jgi:hypothetical protein
MGLHLWPLPSVRAWWAMACLCHPPLGAPSVLPASKACYTVNRGHIRNSWRSTFLWYTSYTKRLNWCTRK